jgi:predicted NACHT family NTPase
MTAFGSTESLENLEQAYREAQKRRFQSERCEKRDGVAVANQQQYLMVLGQPGAGKSTFLRRIGLEALKREESDYGHNCIPVFLELKRFNTGTVDIEQAIAREFETCNFPDPARSATRLLEDGKLLVLLDGLDEVPTQQMDQAITQIQDFCDRYRQNRFIASCRTAAYRSRFRQFRDVIMADFDDEQIQQFMTNWFRSKDDRELDTAQKCWDLLQQPEYAATRELAQTPLLLTFLCLVFDDAQTFPKQRAILYKDALDVLLKRWAAEKRIQRDPIYQDLTLPLEEMMLAEIRLHRVCSRSSVL